MKAEAKTWDLTVRTTMGQCALKGEPCEVCVPDCYIPPDILPRFSVRQVEEAFDAVMEVVVDWVCNGNVLEADASAFETMRATATRAHLKALGLTPPAKGQR